jgi:hypothetical protein
MMFSNETKTGKLLAALQTGEALTEGQIRNRFGLKNPRATVSNIRYAGFAVYANQHKDTKGRVTTKYRIGNPRRSVVAAGYKALSAGLIVIDGKGQPQFAE